MNYIGDEQVAAAQDIVAFCNYNSCFEEEEDENGNTYYTNICPFLDKTDDPWTAVCNIGDPTSWRI